MAALQRRGAASRDRDFFDIFHLVEPGRVKYQSILSDKTIRLLKKYRMPKPQPPIAVPLAERVAVAVRVRLAGAVASEPARPVSTLTLLGIALGLAMDAFAVAIGAGLQLCNVTKRQTFRLAWHFGLFQAFMPILGWLAGLTLVEYIAPVDHWIAFGLLAFIGGKMIYEALKHQDEEVDRCDPTKGWRLVMLSIATSIDALAVGLSMAVLGVEHLVAGAGDRRRRRRR